MRHYGKRHATKAHPNHENLLRAARTRSMRQILDMPTSLDIGNPSTCGFVAKIGLCSEVSDFSSTSEMMTSHQGSINKDGIHSNIQLSRKHQRAVAGKPNNDPSWSSPHVDSTTTVSLRTSYRNFQRPRLRTAGSSPAIAINLDRKPRILGDEPSIPQTDT